MSDNGYGRDSQRAPALSVEDRERIRAEEAFRVQARAEAEAAARVAAKTPQPKVRPPVPPNPEAVRRAALSPEARAREDRRNRIALIVFGIVMAPVAFVIIRANMDAGPRVSAAEREAQRAAQALSLSGQDPYTVREFCLTSVREKLKSPSSARFEEPTQPTWNGSQWTWASYVDAQNSFGAQIRSTFTCEVFGTDMNDARVRTLLLN